MIEVKIYNPTVQYEKDPVSDLVRISFVAPKRPFLFWASRKCIGEMFPFPKGHGAAYYDWEMDRLLMAPMPWNVLIAGLIKIHLWVKYRAVAKKRKEQ